MIQRGCEKRTDEIVRRKSFYEDLSWIDTSEKVFMLIEAFEFLQIYSISLPVLWAGFAVEE